MSSSLYLDETLSYSAFSSRSKLFSCGTIVVIGGLRVNLSEIDIVTQVFDFTT